MSKIIISDYAIESIVANAVFSVDGVASLWRGLKEFSCRLRKEKSSPHGIELFENNGKLEIKVYLIGKYGYNLKEVGKSVQSAVREQVESLTPFKVEEVDTFFVDIENENKEKG